jgi:molybdopterin molybdotransferase
VEDVERVGEKVRVLRAAAPDRFIARRGNEVRAGAVVLERGMKLGAAQLAVAASVGVSRVRVFAAPRAAVLSTGDELVPIDATPGPAQIRNSNSLMLVALLRQLGCDVIDLGIVRDDPAATRAALERGMQHDVLFISGGMSMGEYDYVPRTLIELGAELKITKLRIKPGKPFVFAVKEGRFVFGLPGNPLAGFVCTVRLASRLIARLRGEQPIERWREAKLAEALPPNGPREFYQPIFLENGMAKPLKWKGSADVFTLACANALLVRAENEPALSAGAAVRLLEV